MRPQARRFAEQWLDEHAAETETENVSVKDLSDRLVAKGKARAKQARQAFWRFAEHSKILEESAAT